MTFAPGPSWPAQRDRLFRDPVASVRASLGLPDEVASPTLAEFAEFVKQKSDREDEPVEVLLRAWFVQAGAIKPANVKRDGALLPALHKARPDESEAERLQLLTLDPRGEPATPYVRTRSAGSSSL